MSNVRSIISGIIIGIGVILPGVSGSVIAIMLGIYDKVIYMLNDVNRGILYKIKQLIPLLIGLIIGMSIFGNILLFFIDNYEIQIKYLFIGLILGSVSILKKEIDEKSKFGIDYRYMIATFIFSLFLFIFPNFIFVENTTNTNSFFKMLIAGFLYISGKIVPGISSSFFMMILGLYDYILNIMANPFSITVQDFVSLLPFSIGIFIGVIILIKLINYLLCNYFSKTYSIIIGFILGSIIAIFPGFEFEFTHILSFILMIFAFCLTYRSGKKNKKINTFS